ncbi:MAG: copper chaperone PCu(A)C [Gammaproteobacteria bacterium]|nr:copper chaperone PCu(A)C [Gammaproteobacteria bacterium]
MNKSWLMRSIILLGLIALTVMPTLQANKEKPQIKINDFWIVLAPAVANNTAGYGIIKNDGGQADTLIAIECDNAHVMLHKTEINSGRAQMIHLHNMVIDAHSEVVLEPMSFHLMLMDLNKETFSSETDISLRFKFEKSGVIEVKVPVREPQY